MHLEDLETVTGAVASLVSDSITGRRWPPRSSFSRLDVALPSPVVARAAVLAVAYPVATVVAFTERFRLDRNPTTVPEE